MNHTVSCKTYLSKETTRALKKLLYKTKTVPEIQVKGKIYMERKDYKRLQNSSDVATIYGLGQVQPVYGVVQLLNLFEEKTERVRITSKSNSTISDLRAQLQRNVPVITDMIIANRNVIEIVPKGVC